jgi:Dyp-type peroxidase family
MRTLKGLYRLSVYFPTDDSIGSDGGDRGVLHRFATRLLQEPKTLLDRVRKMMAENQLPDDLAKKLQHLLTVFRDELDWLDTSSNDPMPVVKDRPFDPAQFQNQVLEANPVATHGALVLLTVSNVPKALATFSAMADECADRSQQALNAQIAFTYPGLQALGIAQRSLMSMPQEFVDGMENRSGLLGDVRGNHPDYWRRPTAYNANGADATDARPITTGVVHAVCQMRIADRGAESHELHPTLAKQIALLNDNDNGIRVMAIEPMRSYRDEAGQSIDHFGFVDGISQPVVKPSVDPGSNEYTGDDVLPGELFLGHRTGRDDAPDWAMDPFLVNGTFLVIRKLRQDVNGLFDALDKGSDSPREEALAKMMGRYRDGTPLVDAKPCNDATPSNAFSFEDTAASHGCPYHAHIRLANPRDGRAYTPKIMRRGMSYGPPIANAPDAERGLMFMAYCASIAEQYETIQSWLTAANTTGVGSNPGDPFMSVPGSYSPPQGPYLKSAGEKSQPETRTFRYMDGDAVKRITLPDEAYVRLEWGMYLFVPSLAVLRTLPSFHAPEVTTECPHLAAPTAYTLESFRQILDDSDRAPLVWQQARVDPESMQQTPAGELVGRYQDVLRVMKDDGSNYSVTGYGERMDQSIGNNLLGMDPSNPTRQAQMPLNRAIEQVSEEEAFKITTRLIPAVMNQRAGSCPATR